MRPCSAALKTFLEAPTTSTCSIVDLYTFALQDGSTLRYSGWTSVGPRPLYVPSASFPTGSLNAGSDHDFLLGPRFGRSTVSNKIGIEASELKLQLFVGPDDRLGTYTFANAARIGVFDGALVELDRLFSPSGTTGTYLLDTVSLGCLIWFYGRITETAIGRSGIEFTCRSITDIADKRQFPRRIYQSTCNHVFGDEMCGYDRELGLNALGASTGIGAVTITAEAGSSQSQILDTTFTPLVTPSPYIEGTIGGLTGANAGIKRTISDHDAGTITFKPAFLYPVSVGDTFKLLPGCPHVVDYCNDVLTNLGRFGGFPYIPPPETAV